ncbi:GGDEF domain-containing protein [Pseudoalteromonas sp. B131b]|uniref:GGDEF domain-containing protein n=1 Tax=unclassified Pseudoalteromonas TaxID=194690 RepID=UPI000BBE64DA|nr:GGDEF domain-containing protein [Pseudoalteromonas sp. 1_2015MBL_MicDiv]ATG79976.1 diguanylate cyclase [Pseudoalteromonas sp. 1_2015MBL_MicDiv]
MSDKSNATDKKLKQAIDARMAVEDARKYQVDTLSDFSAKLSLSCKGLDTELDNRLAKFRAALIKGVSFEDLSPLISETIVLLKNQESVQLSQQRDLYSSVQNAGKQLQKTKGLPEDTRRTLRHLLDHEINQVHSTHDFIPLLDQLISFYHQTLSLKLEPASDDECTATPELAQELLKLANELVLEDEATEEIKYIKNCITESDTLDALLKASINIISVIVKNINKERKSAQSFLSSLNQTLEDLHHSIVSTSKHSKSMGVEFDILNKNIESKIKNLNVQTQNATSISSLKELVDNELKSLSKDFIAKEKLERTDREMLVSSFDEINGRIGSLESKLTKYKKRLNEQRFKSLLDSLTKLPNRAAFDERYNHEIHLFNVQSSDVTLAVIDVDHFKSINDRFGHTAGDITLQVIAKALQKSVRKSDFIARYGGEEFVLLMPSTSLINATAPLDKLRKIIKSIPFKFKDKQIEITISLGVTQLKKGDTPIIAFDRADDALYEAKNTGRDRLCISK